MKKNLTTKMFSGVDNVNKSILRQYCLIFALWFTISIILIYLFVAYTVELGVINNWKVKIDDTVVADQPLVKTINDWKSWLYDRDLDVQQHVYKRLVEEVFGSSNGILLGITSFMPIVWFSNMLFIPSFASVTDWKVAWNNKMLQVTTGQVYMLVALVCALIGLTLYLISIIQYSFKIRQTKKMGLSNRYPLYTNDIQLFTMKTYTNFVIAVSIFFCFYELSVTLLMLIYMIVIKKIYKKLTVINAKNNISANIFNSSDLSYFGLLFIIMGAMIGYNLLSSIFMKWLNVDIKIALDALFTTGGIAVVIVGLVKNLLSSSITEVKKKMKNIDNQINQIRFFYHVRQGQAPLDYEYAQILPPIIKAYINKCDVVNTKELKQQFDKLFEYTDFIKDFDYGKKRNFKRRNFILYRMYNEINSFNEIEDIKLNLIKEYSQIKK